MASAMPACTSYAIGQIFQEVVFTDDKEDNQLDRLRRNERQLTALEYDQIELDWHEVIANWLKSCHEGHTCFEDVPVAVPTRLIQLKGKAVKLILTSKADKHLRYATLSYCWGRDKFLMLTAEKVEQWQRSIPLEDLPVVFREAIVLARALDIDYLWIDALCIIQNDESDWLKESALMRMVYGGSYLNIAAATSPSAFHSVYSMPPTHRTALSVRVTTPAYSCVRNIYLHLEARTAIVSNHLATRAWTHQEVLLAPRTVFLGDRGLWWQCHRGDVASHFLKNYHPGWPLSHAERKLNRAWIWELIQHEYSRAHLTKVTDKLPALAGVARRQHEIEGGRYVSGMWEERLLEQLAWAVEIFAKRPVAPWRAPTWSWMSIDGEVFTRNLHNFSGTKALRRRDFVKIIKIYTVPAGPDEFGALTTAHLQLACGFMIPAKSGNIYEPERYEHRYDVSKTFGTSSPDTNAILRVDKSQMLDIPSVPSENSVGQVAGDVVFSDRYKSLDVNLDAPQDDGLEADDLLYILPLFGTSGKALDTGEIFGMDMLDELQTLILKADTNERGTFRRVGIYGTREKRVVEDFLPYMGRKAIDTARKICREIRADAGETDCKFIIKLI